MAKKTFDPTPDSTAVIVDSPLLQRPRGEKPLRVNLELDLAPESVAAGYAARVVETTLNTSVQQATMKLLTTTLQSRRAELLDGLRVDRPERAVQWLLEQVALRLPAQTLDSLLERAAS